MTIVCEGNEMTKSNIKRASVKVCVYGLYPGSSIIRCPLFGRKRPALTVAPQSIGNRPRKRKLAVTTETTSSLFSGHKKAVAALRAFDQ